VARVLHAPAGTAALPRNIQRIITSTIGCLYESTTIIAKQKRRSALNNQVSPYFLLIFLVSSRSIATVTAGLLSSLWIDEVGNGEVVDIDSPLAYAAVALRVCAAPLISGGAEDVPAGPDLNLL
jgi:hypothetical protein